MVQVRSGRSATASMRFRSDNAQPAGSTPSSRIINIDRRRSAPKPRWPKPKAAGTRRLNPRRARASGTTIRMVDMFYSRMWRKMRGIPEGEYIDPAQPASAGAPSSGRCSTRALGGGEARCRDEDGWAIRLEYRERHPRRTLDVDSEPGQADRMGQGRQALRTVGTGTDITRVKLAEAERPRGEGKRLRHVARL